MSEPTKRTAEDAPMSGKAPVAAGAASKLRIPVPGTNGLAIELSPRGWMPRGGSTSTLFIQDLSGKRHLRLDFGYNKATGTVEWHWNQKGTADALGINNHTPAGTAGEIAGNAAKYYKFAGRSLLVVAAAIDVYSIVVASKPLRRTVQVVSAWTLAAAGCKVVGAGGALAGSAVPGVGTVTGGIVGCAVGGFIGYKAGEAASGYLYDWAEGTIFTPVPASARP